MGYVVVAPLVYLKIPDVSHGWRVQSFYRGALVPEDVEEENLQHHIDGQMVVEQDDPIAEVAAVPIGIPIPGEPPNVPVSGTTPENPEQSVWLDKVATAADIEGAAGKPAKSANKEAWVDYAGTKGMPEEEAEQHTKDELIELYG